MVTDEEDQKYIDAHLADFIASRKESTMMLLEFDKRTGCMQRFKEFAVFLYQGDTIDEGEDVRLVYKTMDKGWAVRIGTVKNNHLSIDGNTFPTREDDFDLAQPQLLLRYRWTQPD